MNALADPKVGALINKYFVSAFQRVGTFRIVGQQKQGGNVAAYFCAPDGRVLHCVAGPVNAEQMYRETKWIVDLVYRAMREAKGDGARFKAIVRKAHADKLRQEFGLVVEPILYDPPLAQDPKSALTYRDPTGRPLAPKLPPPPIDGPDVKLRFLQERLAKNAAEPGFGQVRDVQRRLWVLSNQGKVHRLLSAHAMRKIEDLYGAVFEGILGERISTRPVQIVHPFPWIRRASESTKDNR